MSKGKLIKNILKTVGGTGLGATSGGALAEAEIASDFYDNDAVKDVARLTGVGGGSLAGLLLSNRRLRKAKGLKLLALSDIASLLGPKQLALTATDKIQNMAEAMGSGSKAISSYTDIQNDLADKNITITKNQLETANANKEIAERANSMSKNWLDLSKKALPFAGGLAALLTALYAYNTFKNSKKQPIDIKLDTKVKLPERGKESMYLEIPASKVSDKFYNQFSRELLFKDEREKYLETKKKEEQGMNLTSKERKLLNKFEKIAFASKEPQGSKNPFDSMDDIKNWASKVDFSKSDEELLKEFRTGENMFAELLKSKFNNHKKLLDYKYKYNDYEKSLANKKPFETDLTKALFRTRPLHYMPDLNTANAAFLNHKDFGLTMALKHAPEYEHLDRDTKARLFDYVKDVNTPFWKKIMDMLLPMALQLGLAPTQNK